MHDADGWWEQDSALEAGENRYDEAQQERVGQIGSGRDLSEKMAKGCPVQQSTVQQGANGRDPLLRHPKSLTPHELDEKCPRHR